MEGKIVVKKDYFDSIKVAIDGLNIFFTSNFSEKNFSTSDEEETNLDHTLELIVDRIDSVDSEWIKEPEKMNEAIRKLNESMVDSVDGTVPDNEELEDEFDKLYGYKSLQYISDNFPLFNKLINGIYTIGIFTNPSEYKDAIDKFSTPIDLHEIADYVQDNASSCKLFDIKTYVSGLFTNDDIEFPENIDQEAEVNRIMNAQQSPLEIVVDDTVQEAAEINFFTDTTPAHLKYNVKSDRFSVSTQQKEIINKLLAGLRKCETTDDLAKFFSDEATHKTDYPTKLSQVLIPCILAKVFSNNKKYPFEDYDAESMKNYTDSYASIVSKNNGAARFKNYDLFSTFKVDKEGTIQFLKDFLECNLYNDKEVTIPNNTIRTIFNIFDSRIYFDILYNLIPEDVKKDKYPTEDGFVKEIRGRINKNSKAVSTYTDDGTGELTDKVSTSSDVSSKEVKEYTDMMLEQFGDMTVSDIAYCEAYSDIIDMQFKCLPDLLWNNGITNDALDDVITEYFSEKGGIPSYIRDRIDLMDDGKYTKDPPEKVDTSNVDSETGYKTPSNDPDDLADSIEAKLNSDADSLDKMLGSGWKDDPENAKPSPKIVVNITNNYNNSYNQTNTDSSHGKTINDSRRYENSFNDKSVGKSSNSKEGPANNYNNSSPSSDTKDSVNKLSTGFSVQEVFMMLEAEEPLSGNVDATPTKPSTDLSTAAMDVDRKTLPAQQKLKKGVNKVIGTSRKVVKPLGRVRGTLNNIYDSIVKRSEDEVKKQIMEDKSYRNALRKASNIALKVGAFAIFSKINAVLGAAYLGVLALRGSDKQRLRKEMQSDFANEIEIIDKKLEDIDDDIRDARDEKKVAELRQARNHLMRERKTCLRAIGNSMKATLADKHVVNY